MPNGVSTRSLNYTSAEGPNGYVMAVVAPSLTSIAKASYDSLNLRVLNPSRPVPAGGLRFNVPQGGQNLHAALRTPHGKVPANVSVKVIQPDGTPLPQATPPDASDQVVLENGTHMLVGKPQSGLWTVFVEADPSAGEFQFFISTIPNQDVVSTMRNTLTSIANQQELEKVLGDAHPSDIALAGFWTCFWCKLGFYSLAALILAGVALLGGWLFPAASVAITATATALGITEGEAIVFVAALAGFELQDICVALCQRLGACA